MTKKEFIEKLSNMPDNAEVKFWNFERMQFDICKPHYFENENFIGIE